DDAAAGAVVGRALAEVPRIEMGADDDDLFGLVAATDFADDVVHDDRAGNELVGDVDLDARAGRLGPAGEPPQHFVVVVRDRRGGNAVGGAGPILALPAAGREQQAEVLARVEEDGGRPFADEEVGPRLR